MEENDSIYYNECYENWGIVMEERPFPVGEWPAWVPDPIKDEWGYYKETLQDQVTSVGSTYVPGDVVAIIMYLQEVFDLLESGEADSIMSDPAFKREPGKENWTDEEIDEIIDSIEAEFQYELKNYGPYHKIRSGGEELPGFDRLSPGQRRAVVENLDIILRDYAMRDKRLADDAKLQSK